MQKKVHTHVLALDGVHVGDQGSEKLVSHELPTPTQGEVAEVARRTAERRDQLLRARPEERKRWAWLIVLVFAKDVETCGTCGGAMRWADVAAHPNAIARLVRASQRSRAIGTGLPEAHRA